jgi:hypothetical protein
MDELVCLAMRSRDQEDWNGFLLHVAKRRELSPGRNGKQLLDMIFEDRLDGGGSIAHSVSRLIIHNTQASDVKARFGTNRHRSIESQGWAARNERPTLKLVIFSEVVDD